MQEDLKKKILVRVRAHIADVQTKITAAIAAAEKKVGSLKKDIHQLAYADQLVQHQLKGHASIQMENLKQLLPSPYFFAGEFKTEDETKKFFIGKFSFGEENIYSWITPIAALRFENPGMTSYTRPDGTQRTGELLRKDQYLIVDGQLRFMATESMTTSRELVYQEHFTKQKPGFILPEVVEQMEKAQDQVVRAAFRGPFVISGPAGSGKTTLALHRVAYLMQSPETAEFFTPEAVLVLVQDKGTQDYFSHLLPELGIRGVKITTFSEWGLAVLNLVDYSVVSFVGTSEEERYAYEFAKLSALRAGLTEFTYNKNIFTLLNQVYKNNFTLEQQKLFLNQKKNKILDRFDLTILLQIYHTTFGEFSLQREHYVELNNGTYKKKTTAFPVQHNLMVIDEFQNYLPEQLRIIKSCLNKRAESIVYVGDVAQQIQLGTMRDWKDLDAQVEDDRIVALQKVYRNTKQILQYIAGLGYPVSIPDQIKSGPEVVEKILSPEEEILFIQEIVDKTSAKNSVGILATDRTYLEKYKKQFAGKANVHCLSFAESQGVEFETVCIVGITEKSFAVEHVPAELVDEIKKIKKDLLYVALTRAMGEMYVFWERQT